MTQIQAGAPAAPAIASGTPTALARAWLWLGVMALIGSGVLAVLLLMSLLLRPIAVLRAGIAAVAAIGVLAPVAAAMKANASVPLWPRGTLGSQFKALATAATRPGLMRRWPPTRRLTPFVPYRGPKR